MIVSHLPEELATQIDEVAPDRTPFITEAVRRRHKSPTHGDETARNELADELTQELEDIPL